MGDKSCILKLNRQKAWKKQKKMLNMIILYLFISHIYQNILQIWNLQRNFFLRFVLYF